MSDALLALHFQNDICHPDGRIPFSLDRKTKDAAHFLDASKRALVQARRAGWTIAHVHIAFAEDYSDLMRNCRLFLKTETLGALKRGSWGAVAFADERLDLALRQARLVVLPLAFHRNALLKRHRLPIR